MNENHVSRKNHITFEKIRQRDGSDAEYWSARDLQPVLEYGSWDKFKRVIEKAMVACEQSGHSVDDHFSHMGKMVCPRIVWTMTAQSKWILNKFHKIWLRTEHQSV